VPHLVLRYNLTFIGYNQGNKFLQKLSRSNVMDKLTFGASILGLMVVGAMPALLMSIKTPITIGSGDSPVAVQSILDQIIPNILPLALTFLVYYFVRKNVKTTYLLLGLLLTGFIGSMIHLFV
jgi:fructoselysine and glucoselysine-specific PTS system IID component